METITKSLAKMNHLAEYEAIVKTMQYYIDGSLAGNSKLMRPGFHPDAKLVGYVSNELLFTPAQYCLTGLMKTEQLRTLNLISPVSKF